MKLSASAILIVLLAVSETVTAVPRKRRITRKFPTLTTAGNGVPTLTTMTIVTETDDGSTGIDAESTTATGTGGAVTITSAPAESETSDVAVERTTKATSSAKATTTAGNGGGGNGALVLDPENVQDASSKTGQEAGDNPAQADSLTDSANFINFCKGKTLTNGQQVKSGSCNGIVMGDIPSTANMVSTIITFPSPGETLSTNTEFIVKITVANLVAGSFTNPANTYYAAPQTLQGGKIVGHTHITIQSLGTLNTKTVPDAASFVFFKGINDSGDGNGNLEAVVTGGLPAGVYRVCTMSSSSNHQPVLMPIAQRGAQDDCTKFTVGGGGGGNGGAN